MTICISAICEGKGDHPHVVIASDRMITSEGLSIEFEQKQNKIFEASSSCAIVSAGDALSPADILRRAQSGINEMTAPSIEEVANKIKDELVKYRKEDVEDQILKPRGFGNLEQFYEKMQSLPPDIYTVIDDRISRFDDIEKTFVEFLVSGIDETGAHIYSVYSPGRKSCFDTIGYNAIGTGDTHAVSVLTSYNYTNNVSLNDAIWIVYEAKRRAEKAPGVGRGTDMCVITKSKVTHLEDKLLKELETQFKKKGEQETVWLRQIPKFELGA